MWEIREGYDPDEMRMGMRGGMDPEEAYEEGCRHGYKKGYGDAMRDASEEYGYRGGMGFRDENTRGMSYGQSGRSSLSYGNRMPYPPYVNYRDDEDEMNERRRRDSRGRYM